jgi:hypothetical protein
MNPSSRRLHWTAVSALSAMLSPRLWLIVALLLGLARTVHAHAAEPASPSGEPVLSRGPVAPGSLLLLSMQQVEATGDEGDLQIEVVKKGLGKEVSIRKGTKEWYMLIEVTSDNTVVVRQEKDNETYLVDESETHDRAMTKGEVDAAIEDFISGVKAQVRKRK